MALTTRIRCYRCGIAMDVESGAHDLATDAVGVVRPVLICWGCHTGEPAGIIWHECAACGVVSDSDSCGFCDLEG